MEKESDLKINRVRRSVNPTNHIKYGIRQVLFPYIIFIYLTNINLSIYKNLIRKSKC